MAHHEESQLDIQPFARQVALVTGGGPRLRDALTRWHLPGQGWRWRSRPAPMGESRRRCKKLSKVGVVRWPSPSM